ncbi:hypothetical protein MJO29_000812 [Puccinia striiformis f. sp. tritici]|uniref:Uncharacterized protein n=1 Tax=Puccinia striiformis f. sp. tritici PST-78 TaxID=1165861 RepID=A0A0L0VYD0_9BASI|nr:hypothetical protein Pst134EA_000824 [Puccinia striiformis f. sp. tritici]KAI9600963.1 hypothetical protein H4Q26_000757 [Puccinia striiformis f. sp. tritici PST-130]KNF04283.1 hypothetical protein PSTG_02626 [Puccinia striiformis f. sp. tritici PST-78]KAH9466994.1 hypothetical protein Pst134EB_002029 [Puccinia striiformis f. sp. tritici]KAH9473754.1 hypothetical protein Pst134EA_000824 [Puccinia striiformis f. sp. tritici]KAI7967535.1 hypothetical protein MJO29_000812 [Puccinia striiformis
MAEQILLGFFWCSIASLALVAITSQSNFFASILSIIIEFLLILKIFGIALLVIISLGIAIVLWEQVISQSQLWLRFSNKFLNQPHHSKNPGQRSPSLNEYTKDEQRSILPIVSVIGGLGLFVILDTSFLLPTTNTHQYSSSTSTPNHQPYPERKKYASQNTRVIQFSSAILTLALVVGFIVFNKDEYGAWKARRKLSEIHRRRARQVHSLISSSPK